MTLPIGIAPSSLAKFKDQVREKWSANQSLKSKELRNQWNSYLRGWWGYYRLSEDRGPIFRQEPWIRRHIRKCFWQRWRSGEGRSAKLRKLGVPKLGIAAGELGAWPNIPP